MALNCVIFVLLCNSHGRPFCGVEILTPHCFTKTMQIKNNIYLFALVDVFVVLLHHICKLFWKVS